MKEINKKGENLSLIKIQEGIIDFAKSNEIFKNKILDESFINSPEFDYIKHIDSIKENLPKEPMNEVNQGESKNNSSILNNLKRSYHTSACNYSNKEMLIKDPEVVYSEESSKKVSNKISKIKKYPFSFYLEEIKEIIDNSVGLNDDEKRETQKKIEKV
jgi:hypothetical protein